MKRRQGGVALAIVLWFIAGMTLLVAGIVSHARVDTQMAQIHMARAKAVAAGDGAIQLMMVDLMTAAEDPGPAPVGNYRLGGTDVGVALVPAAGLIDINTASVDVLSALFLLAAGMSEEEARWLAENMVQSRSAGPEGGLKLDAIEDMLRIPGSSRSLLDAVRDFIVVGISGQGTTDWSQAPDALLKVLALANTAQAESARSQRVSGGGARANAYRADAYVRYGDKTWLRRRWISIESRPGSALPWHAIRTEPPRVLAQDSYLLGRGI